MDKEQTIELLEHLAWDKDNEGNCYGEALQMAIDALRQPEKIMHWEQKVIHSEFKREQLEETVIYICDRCGQRSEKETNFCPNCGAKADWFCEKDGGRKMTNAEAIETLRANYPDACFEQLREAVDVAIKALKAQDIAGDTISRQWLLDCINDGWIKFDTDKDTNRFIHLVRDIAPPAQPEPKRRN